MMQTRLNPATPDTYPNPGYAVRATGAPTFTEGSAGNVTIGASAQPTPPPYGSTKKDWEAYATALASWEREQMWRQIPASATQQEIEDWFGEARYDLPTVERREWEIYRSGVPYVTERQLVIEAQYAQQRQNILSSSGVLVPTETESYSYLDDSGWYADRGTRVSGWQNVTRGDVFAPTAITPEVLGKAVETAGGAVVKTAMPAVGLIAGIARAKLGQDYITGGSIFDSVLQEKRPAPTTTTEPSIEQLRPGGTALSGPTYGGYTFKEGAQDYWTFPIAAGAMIGLEILSDTFTGWKGVVDTSSSALGPLEGVGQAAGHTAVGFARFFPESFLASALFIPGVEFAVREPARFAQSVVPGSVAMGAGMLEQAKQDPWEAAGMVAGAVLGPKIARAISPIKSTGAIGLVDMELPKPRVAATYRGIYFESPLTSLRKTIGGGGFDWYGVKHLAGVTTTPEGVTPRFQTMSVLGKSVKFSTGVPKHLSPLVGTELFVPDIGSVLTVPLMREEIRVRGAPNTLKIFDTLTTEMWKQRTTEPPMMKNPYKEIDLVKTVPKGHGAELLDTIKTASHGEFKIGGSYGKRVQGLYEGEMGDIDLYVAKKYQPETTKQLIDYYSRYLGKENVRMKGAGGVEIRTGGDWKHAVDMHIIEDYKPGMLIGRYDVQVGKPVTVEGVHFVPYHELTLRYLTESMHLLKTEKGWKLGPDYHRGKDVAKSLATLYELRGAYTRSTSPVKWARLKSLGESIEVMEVMTAEGYLPVKTVARGRKTVTYDIRADVLTGLEKRRFMFSAGYEPVYPETIPTGAVSDWSGLPIPQDVPISKVFHHVEYPNKGVWLTPEEHLTLHQMLEGKVPMMEIPKGKIRWEVDIDSPVSLPIHLLEPARQVGKPGTFYHATSDFDFINRISGEKSFVVKTHGLGSDYPQEGFFFGPKDTVYTQFLYDITSHTDIGAGGTGGGLLRLQTIPSKLPSKATRLIRRQQTIERLVTELEEFPQFRENILAEASRLNVDIERTPRSSYRDPSGRTFESILTDVSSERIFGTLPKGKLYPGVEQYPEFIIPEGTKIHVIGTSKIARFELPGFKEVESVLDYGPLSDEVPSIIEKWSWGRIERIPIVDVSLGDVLPTKAFFEKYVPLTRSRYTKMPLTRKYVDLSVWESRLLDPILSKVPSPYAEWGIPVGYPWGIIEERVIRSEPVKIQGIVDLGTTDRYTKPGRKIVESALSAAPKGRVKVKSPVSTDIISPIYPKGATIEPTISFIDSIRVPVVGSMEGTGKYQKGKPKRKPVIARTPRITLTPAIETPALYPPGRPPKTPPVVPPSTPPVFTPVLPPTYPPGRPPKTPPKVPPEVPPTFPPIYPPGRPPKVPPTYPPGRPPGKPPTYPPPKTPPPEVPPTYPPPEIPPPVFPPPTKPPIYPPRSPPKTPPVIIRMTATKTTKKRKREEYPGKLDRVWPEFFPYVTHAPVISPTSMLKGVLSGKKLKPVRS